MSGAVPAGLSPGETFIHQKVRITADLAELFLAVNAPFNRPVSWNLVRDWAGEMLAGEWSAPSPEGMVFSSAGEMLDGRTRCQALKLAAETDPNVFITLDVHHNYDPEIYAKLNRGRKRTSGHAVSSAGFKSGNHHAAVVLMLLRYRAKYDVPPIEYQGWRRVKSSPQRIVDTLKATPDLVTCWDLSYPPRAYGFMNRTAAAVGIYLLREAAQWDPKKLHVVDQFILGIADPVEAWAGTDDPRTVLNRAFTRRRDRAGHEYLGLFLRGWEMWCKGKTVTSLVWTDGPSKMLDVHIPKGDWSGILKQWVRS